MSFILFMIANIAIFVGYMVIARYIVPNLNIQFLSTKLGGTAFFLLCAMTHLELAIHAYTKEPITQVDFMSWHMLVIHVLQAIAVGVFTFGLYKEVGRTKGRFLRLSKNKQVVRNLITDVEQLQHEAMYAENAELLDRALADMNQVERNIASHDNT